MSCLAEVGGVSRVDAWREEGVVFDATSEDHFVPDTRTEILAGGIGVVAIHAHGCSAVGLLLPSPTDIERVRLLR